MTWVWVLSITVLGSNPEHIRMAKYETKQECQQNLIARRKEYEAKGKEIVGHCFYGKIENKGWW